MSTASITQHNVTMPSSSSETKVFEQDIVQFPYIECHGESWNLDDFAAVNRGILQTGLRNLENWALP